MKTLAAVTTTIFMLVSLISVHAQISNWEMAAKMGRGINMGNTLEMTPEGSLAMAAQEYFFDDYKNNGFTNVRIPVHWGNKIDGAGNVDVAFMDRVEQVVDMALARGLVAVINVHHENWVIDNYLDNKDKILYIWEQIANRFKDKHENLVFELFNEPRNDMHAGRVTDFNQAVVPVIRATNPTRILIVGAGAWGHWSDLFNVSYPVDNYTMCQFHYYDPHTFTHMGDYDFWNHDQIWSDFAQFVSYIHDTKGIPLYCGEFGVMHSNAQYAKDWNAVLAYYDNVTEVLNHYGIPYSVWDDEGWFGIYNRRSRTFNDILGQLNAPGDPVDTGCDTLSVSTIEAENYCAMQGVQTEDCSEGGLNVGWIERGDWVAYTIHVPASGLYKLTYHVASKDGGGSFRLEEKGGSTSYGTLDVPATGDWQAWTTISHEVTFTEGVQEITIVATGDGWNLNKFVIESLFVTGMETYNSLEFTIYPNPARGSQLTVHRNTKSTTTVPYSIRSLQTGAQIQEGTLTTDEDTIPISTLAAGIYLIEVCTDSRVYLKKLIVE